MMMSLRLLCAYAVQLGTAAAAAPCEFSVWKFGPVRPGGTPTATCDVLDLSAMPRTVFRMNDSFPDAYAVSAPCVDVVLGSVTCTSSAVQSPTATSCGLALGALSHNSTAALPSGADGMRITMIDGDGGRTLVYDMVCDKAASPAAGPTGLVGTHVAGFPNPALTYLITWPTPHACARDAPELLGTGKCGAQSVAVPTANQIRYQTGEIVALTHFNMASFVKNGDPGCDASNWLTKAPTAAGPSGDPATFNPTQLDTDQWAEAYKSFGVKGAVITAKHGCGHLLWPTKVAFDDGSPYTYCVGKKDSAIKQDVLALFSASMEKANITHGFYYSFTNNFYMNVASHVAGHSKTVLKGQVNVSQAEFERIALAQVKELWSNYGQLGEIWFDGGYGGDVGPAIKKLIQNQKLAVGFGGAGVIDSPVGWVGTESGLPGGREIWSIGNTAPTQSTWQPVACDTTLQIGDTWYILACVVFREDA
jgi:alpha-L-fucosidase